MKRFTETTMWDDKWFRRLPAMFKLAWRYVCDTCDIAGVMVLDEDLATFRMGEAIDWDAFIEACEGRIARLANGKIHLVKFIEFQYGTLSERCKPHQKVLALLDKHGLDAKGSLRVSDRVCDRVSDTLQEEDKEEDKEEDPNTQDRNGSSDDKTEKPAKRKVAPGSQWLNPLDQLPPDIRSVVDDWIAYKGERKEPYKPAGLKALASRIVKLGEAHGYRAVSDAIERAMANRWAGWDHDWQSPSAAARAGPSKGKQQTFAQQRVANSKRAVENLLAGDE